MKVCKVTKKSGLRFEENKNQKNQNNAIPKIHLGKKTLFFCMVFFAFCLSACGKPESTAISAEYNPTEIGLAVENDLSSSQLEDGIYRAEVILEGGTGKASIASPAEMTVRNGEMFATLVWSSKNYDYMLVQEKKYENETPGEKATFTIPVEGLDIPFSVIADTTAMSTPHEIEYQITLHLLTENQAGIRTDSVGATNSAKTEKQETESLELNASDWGEADIRKIPLLYATQFSAYEINDCKYLSISGEGGFLVIPEGVEAPKQIPEGTIVLQRPIQNTYLVSTSAMDLIRECGATGAVRLSGTKENDWYIPEAVEAMEKGDLLYAGKYAAPDYERILGEACDLAIENTMIYHTPEVKEKLEELGIPVLVERSSYEAHPLGRMEWIKVYGILFGKEAPANAFFEKQAAAFEKIAKKDAGEKDTRKTVAFFYLSANGSVNVRKPSDYIPKMIEMAGGYYVLNDILPEEDNALATMNMQWEDFYACAQDADILIYNSTVNGQIDSVEDLIKQNVLFSDFKAVQEGEVYCTTQEFFQKTTGIAEFLIDLNHVIEKNDDTYTYLRKCHGR